jgi:hypothetical protein
MVEEGRNQNSKSLVLLVNITLTAFSTISEACAKPRP